MRTLIWFILALLLSTLSAKEVNSDQVRVAYVYNFLKHTNWQNESQFQDYDLLVVSKNQNLKNMFLMLSSRKLLNDKKIKVSFYDGKKSPKNIQAIYVDSESAELYEKLFNEYESYNVLFISDEYKDKQKVMINLIPNGEIVGFELNKANIINRSLQVSPDLVLLGGSEIDVAKLYKSSQNELKEQKETVAGLSKKIKERNSELAEKIAAIELQKTELIAQESKIGLQNAMITKQLQAINDQKNTIISQQVEVDNIYKNIDKQKAKLLIEEQKIAEKEKILKTLLASHYAKQQEINNANKELERLNKEIVLQKKNLVQKEGIISTQRGAIGALLFLFSIIILLVLYVVKQNKLLNTLSQTDTLTGLLNRRALMEKINAEVLKYNRYAIPFSILFIDLDHFKMINDSYGHDKGDRVLKIIASLMNQHTRDTDICVRWGGEEFMILATNTDLDNAIKLGENFRSIIENYDFNLGRKVTVSIGVSTMKKGLDKDMLVKVADNALYIAKENGRNSIFY